MIKWLRGSDSFDVKMHCSKELAESKLFTVVLIGTIRLTRLMPETSFDGGFHVIIWSKNVLKSIHGGTVRTGFYETKPSLKKFYHYQHYIQTLRRHVEVYSWI